MSGETEKAVSGWTVDTLKEHVERRLLEAEKAINAALIAAKEAVAAALASSEKATEKAEENAERWRANANEWRGSMLDREAKFASKDQMDTELRAIRVEIASLRESRAEGVGGKAVWALILTLIGLGVAAASIFLSRSGG